MSSSRTFLCCFRKKKKPKSLKYELYHSKKGNFIFNLNLDRTNSIKEHYIIFDPVLREDFIIISPALSLKKKTNSIFQEHLIDFRHTRVNFSKLFCIESMLDEFSSEDLCPFLEPYLDYSVKRENKFCIIEIAYQNRGMKIDEMTKFEKAIIFKDFRDILVRILMTLSFLKARVVQNNKWFKSTNVKFNMDNFQPILSNYVVIDVENTSGAIEYLKKVDLIDIGGEKQKFQLESKIF